MIMTSLSVCDIEDSSCMVPVVVVDYDATAITGGVLAGDYDSAGWAVVVTGTEWVPYCTVTCFGKLPTVGWSGLLVTSGSLGNLALVTARVTSPS